MIPLTKPVPAETASGWVTTHLIGGRVQAQQGAVAPLQACLGITPVHLLCGRTFQHGRQESVRGGILQVKDTGGPAPPGGLVEADRPALCVILKAQKRETGSEIMRFLSSQRKMF